VEQRRRRKGGIELSSKDYWKNSLSLSDSLSNNKKAGEIERNRNRNDGSTVQ